MNRRTIGIVIIVAIVIIGLFFLTNAELSEGAGVFIMYCMLGLLQLGFLALVVFVIGAILKSLFGTKTDSAADKSPSSRGEEEEMAEEE